MTRLLPVLLCLAPLSSCVTSFRAHRLEAIPYRGHGPVFRYEVSPRMIDASPEVAPILRVMYLHADTGLSHASQLLAKLTSDQPLLVPVLYKGREMYQLVEEFTILGVTLPKGLIVDGASVPRACWAFMPPDGLHRRGALFHDLAYEREGKLPNWTLTRHDADTCLYNLMVEDGVSPTRAGIVFRAVRLFGGSSWGAHAPIIEPVERRMYAARIIKPRNLFSHIYAP